MMRPSSNHCCICYRPFACAVYLSLCAAAAVLPPPPPLLLLQLSALVLAKLLSSLPTMRCHLRSGYLLGDTRSDKTGSLAMNNKVCMAMNMNVHGSSWPTNMYAWILVRGWGGGGG
jgi:hypothetical protein